jgi:hypothetical protein
MNTTVTMTIEDANGVERDYEVEVYYTEYDPGVCSGPVEKCYPPEGGECEIQRVWDSEGRHLTDDEIKALKLDPEEVEEAVKAHLDALESNAIDLKIDEYMERKRGIE